MNKYRKSDPRQSGTGYGMGTRSSGLSSRTPSAGRNLTSSPTASAATRKTGSVSAPIHHTQAPYSYGGSRNYGGISITPKRPNRRKGKWLIGVVLLLLAAAGTVLWLLLSEGEPPTDPKNAQLSLQQHTPEATSTISPTSEPTAELSATPVPTNAAMVASEPQSDFYCAYDSSLRWYMQQLTPHEKELFAILYDGIAAVNKVVSVPSETYTEQEFDRVIHVLRKDCPELVHFNGQAAISYRMVHGYLHSVDFTYLYEQAEENLAATQKVLEIANHLLQPAEHMNSAVEVEHRLYRHVIEKAVYDKDFEHSSNADAVFVHGKAKCTGFAYAFALACRMHGIPCIYATGDGTTEDGTDGHAWNYVQIDGNWYICDPTWDRNFVEKARQYPQPASSLLSYFNLTDKQVEDSHKLDEEDAQLGWHMPECISEMASFENVFGFVTRVDADNWKPLLTEQLNEAARGQRQVIVLKVAMPKDFTALSSAFKAHVDEWIATTCNWCSYTSVTIDSSRFFILYDFEWTAENPYRDSKLKVYFLDVGDADAALVDCEGHIMLIDGGTEKSGSSQLYSFLENNGITFVDALVVTHPHSDHAGGLCGALSYEKCEFGTFYSSVKSSDNKSFNTLLEKAEARGLKPIVPDVGTQFWLGNALVTFLSPQAEKSYENVNNKSLVLRVDYGNTSFLFTGDAMENAEQDMLLSDMKLRADVLKVAHHGANSSSSLPFLSAVSPSLAIISCGPEIKDHPGSDTLKRLAQTAGTVLRTDESGRIVVFSDGEQLTLSTQK